MPFSFPVIDASRKTANTSARPGRVRDSPRKSSIDVWPSPVRATTSTTPKLPAAMTLAKKYDVEMPIVQAVDAVVSGGADPADAVAKLMQREKRTEARGVRRRGEVGV